MILAVVTRAILVALAGAAATAAQLDIPNKEFWSGHRYLLYASIFIVAYVAMAEALRLSLPSIQARKVREYEQNIRSTLSSGVREVVDKFSLSWEDVGVHAFLIRGFWPFRRLVNVGGVRLSAKPSMTRPIWRPGKGVVGEAFRTATPLPTDWEAFYAAANSAGRSAWRAQGEWYHRIFPRWGKEYRISWGELQLTAEYKGIVAKPIFASGGKKVGCVVIDAPLSATDLAKPEMEAILRDVSGAVVLAGVPPRAWWSYRI
ncbi:hypothetical protein AB0368_06475 [Actinoplanes sp. NPDC051475]|uniref:hypothetical protein n=1 Tax=Actinoplanes sp. NPDC051475 TaxID=3157225 RepID=UPI00344B398D